MPNEQKVGVVEDLRHEITESNGFLLTEYRGLTVSELTQLRRKLRETSSEYRIVKNTLFKRAAGDIVDDTLSGLLTGPTAVTFVGTDAIAAAKALVDFARDHKAMVVKGGFVDGQVYGAAEVTALSKVPPKEQLLASLLGSLQSPLSGLVGTLQGVVSEFVFTLQAVADKKSA